MPLITNWTRQIRYQPYSDWSIDYQQQLLNRVQNSPYRLNYHIQPDTGLLNDPNGFSYFNHQWHLFYQSYPMGPVHGLKSWHHLISDDLIDWRKATPLLPGGNYDSHGAYSGSALPINDRLFLFYTGNVRNSDWERTPFQNGAWLSQAGTISKISEPLIKQPRHYTDHFRDPMIFKYQDQIMALIGAQDNNKIGKIAVFKADHNNINNWRPLGELTFTSEKLGYMVECPNLIFINHQPVLIFCPQGLTSEVISYQNIYPNMYVVGHSFELNTTTITQPSELTNLDDGFDCYATQAFNAPDGRALAVSWLGLPEIEYPTDKDGWAHCLSLVKELTLHDNHLYQYPVEETKALRQTKQIVSLSKQSTIPTTNAYELELEVPANTSQTLHIFSNPSKSNGLVLTIDTTNGKITMDRSAAGVSFGQQYGQIRTTNVQPHHPIHINLFADQSVVELYINHGAKVMSSRLFPAENQNTIWAEIPQKAQLWPLSKVNNN